MKIKNVIIIFIVSYVLLSCKTVQIDKSSFTTTSQKVQLAGIGLESNNIFKKSFQNSAIIHLKNPIRVSVLSSSFNKKTYEAYKKSTMRSELKIAYNDSVQQKPRFVTLSIMDEVGLLNELNGKHNESITSYLKNTENPDIVTKISLALALQDLELVLNAEAVFLVQDGLKNHALSLQTENQEDKIIKFSDGVVFAYRASTPCWQEQKQQVKIVGLVEGYDSCPEHTFRSAKRAKKKVNYFKL